MRCASYNVDGRSGRQACTHPVPARRVSAGPCLQRLCQRQVCPRTATTGPLHLQPWLSLRAFPDFGQLQHGNDSDGATEVVYLRLHLSQMSLTSSHLEVSSRRALMSRHVLRTKALCTPGHRRRFRSGGRQPQSLHPIRNQSGPPGPGGDSSLTRTVRACSCRRY
jgi:hypothetical protein